MIGGGFAPTADHLQLLVIFAVLAIGMAIYAYRKDKRRKPPRDDEE